EPGTRPRHAPHDLLTRAPALVVHARPARVPFGLREQFGRLEFAEQVHTYRHIARQQRQRAEHLEDPAYLRDTARIDHAVFLLDCIGQRAEVAELVEAGEVAEDDAALRREASF